MRGRIRGCKFAIPLGLASRTTIAGEITSGNGGRRGPDVLHPRNQSAGLVGILILISHRGRPHIRSTIRCRAHMRARTSMMNCGQFRDSVTTSTSPSSQTNFPESACSERTDALASAGTATREHSINSHFVAVNVRPVSSQCNCDFAGSMTIVVCYSRILLTFLAIRVRLGRLFPLPALHAMGLVTPLKSSRLYLDNLG